jgi:hypothetical protein
MILIEDSERLRVENDRHRFVERNAVFPEIPFGFARVQSKIEGMQRRPHSHSIVPGGFEVTS